MAANHKDADYLPCIREKLHVCVCLYVSSHTPLHGLDSAALYFTQNHQGATVENHMKHKAGDGRELEGGVRKIKSNNGTARWQPTKTPKNDSSTGLEMTQNTRSTSTATTKSDQKQRHSAQCPAEPEDSLCSPHTPP